MSQRTANERILFGLKVKQLRQAKQLNFSEFAKATGMSVSYLNEIEKGKKYPKEDKIRLIANALEVEPQDLTSMDLGKHLSPLSELLSSNFLNELPLELFDIELSKVIEIIANAPMKVGAFISTLVDISRNYSLAEENFYFGALRSYLEMHNNYFEEIEQAAIEFSEKNKLSEEGHVGVDHLSKLLERKFGYTIVENGLAEYPELAHIRSVFLPKRKRLLLNQKLTDMQKAFQFGKELGFNYLNLKERANTAKLLRVNSFEEVLSHFKAGYFSAALLIQRENFVEDVRRLFELPRWDGEFVLNLLRKYQASPEMLFQRITNLLPKYFGLENIFLMRFVHSPTSGRFKLNRELHLNRRHRPHGNALAEHYCRRWLSISLLGDLAKMQSAGTYAGALVGVQRSQFHGTEDEYLTFTIAKPDHPSSNRNVSITVGILVDDNLRKQVNFLDDISIAKKEVNILCERCPIQNCEVRAANATVLEKWERVKNVERVLGKLK